MATRAKRSKRLVIDASVARAAGGEEASYPVSKNCRNFLKAVLTICHRIVMTPEIGEEWKRHRSNFAQTWLASMQGRKKVFRLDSATNYKLRDKIERAASQMKEHEREAMRKDFLLIESSVMTDCTVISLDDAVRRLFAEALQSVGELKNVVWVNPGRIEEELIRWLENGAKPEKGRRLSREALPDLE